MHIQKTAQRISETFCRANLFIHIYIHTHINMYRYVCIYAQAPGDGLVVTFLKSQFHSPSILNLGGRADFRECLFDNVYLVACSSMCCSVLQCVAVCARVLQCVAGCCRVLQGVANVCPVACSRLLVDILKSELATTSTM